jgi:hypothetical protein
MEGATIHQTSLHQPGPRGGYGFFLDIHPDNPTLCSDKRCQKFCVVSVATGCVQHVVSFPDVRPEHVMDK